MTSQLSSSWFRNMHQRLALLPRRLTFLSLALMICILAASAYLLDRAWLNVRRDSEQTAWNLALTAADDFHRSIQSLTVKFDTIMRATSAQRGSGALASQMDDTLRQTSDEVFALIRLDAHGHVLDSTSKSFKRGQDLSGLDVFQAALSHRQLPLGQPITVGGEQLLPLARVVSQADGSMAVGITMLRLSYFQNQLIAEDLDPRDVIALFVIGGAEILRSPAPPPVAEMVAGGHALTQALGDDESTTNILRSRIDRVTRLAVVVRAGALHLGVLVAVPEAVLWQSWLPQAFWIIGFTVGLLAMMLAFHFTLAAELQRRHQAEAEAGRIGEQYRLLAEFSSDVLCEIRFDGGFRYASPAMERLFGWTREELVGVDPRMMPHPEDLAFTRETAETLSPDSGPRIMRFRHLCKDGSYLWVEANIQLIWRNDVAEGFVSVIRDISDRVAAERHLAEASTELARLAATDQLTGLGNRRRFDEELDREWRRAAREEAALSLLMFDIDFFKLYNDAYGHGSGDEVLQAVATAAAAILRRPTDLVARWGGEEFVVLLPNTEPTGAMMVAEQMRAAVEALEIPHCGSQFGHLTVSVGVATTYPGFQQTAKSLIAEADANLYQAKRQGRNRIGVARNDMTPPAAALLPAAGI